MTTPQQIMAQTQIEMGIKSTTINGKEYSITLLPALPAYLLGTQIVEMMLPSLGSAFDSSQSADEVFPEDRVMVTEIAMYLVKGLQDLDKQQIIDQLLLGATSNQQLVDYKSGMRGESANLAKLIEYALVENLSDFFTGYIKEKVSSLPSLMKSLMPNTETPTK